MIVFSSDVLGFFETAVMADVKMSEVLRDLHTHSLFGFDQEIIDLHQVHSMSSPATAVVKSSKKGLKKLATLDEVMIKPSSSGVYHRLPRDEETPNHNYNGFEAWSQTHLMSGAMLPLQDYFIDFFVFVGLSPYQLIPQAYRLLSGLYIFYVARNWAPPRLAKILYFYELLSVPKKGDKFKDGLYNLQTHSANEIPVPFNFQKNVKEYRHQFKAFEHPNLLTDWVRVPPMHRTAPTQLFLNHAQVFAGYKKEELNVGDLVMTANYRRAKLILESQSVEDFKLSKVICSNVRNPGSVKTLREDIISSTEDKYNKYRFKREQELAFARAQAAFGRIFQ
uniref:Uncharacterized protein n=1 Tax=Cannabis sativa TaxID=3483 RepID=A0A803NKC2_CANSA